MILSPCHFLNLYFAHPQAANDSFFGVFFCLGVCSSNSSSPLVIVTSGGIARITTSHAFQRASFNVETYL